MSTDFGEIIKMHTNNISLLPENINMKSKISGLEATEIRNQKLIHELNNTLISVLSSSGHMDQQNNTEKIRTQGLEIQEFLSQKEEMVLKNQQLVESYKAEVKLKNQENQKLLLENQEMLSKKQELVKDCSDYCSVFAEQTSKFIRQFVQKHNLTLNVLETPYVSETPTELSIQIKQWTLHEITSLRTAVDLLGDNWSVVAKYVNETATNKKTETQCKYKFMYDEYDSTHPNIWNKDELLIYNEAREIYGKNWDAISQIVKTKTAEQCKKKSRGGDRTMKSKKRKLN